MKSLGCRTSFIILKVILIYSKSFRTVTLCNFFNKNTISSESNTNLELGLLLINLIIANCLNELPLSLVDHLFRFRADFEGH